MPSYSRTVQVSSKSAQELYDVISREIDRFLAKSSVGNYELERLPDEKKIRAKSSMFSADLTCTDQSIRLDVNLSFLATPFRGKLDEGITKWLQKNFPGLVS